jgi:hypothetical protein
MSLTTNEFFENIKKLLPDLTDDEAQDLQESIETYCEIIIDIYMENERADDKQTQSE